MKTHFTQEWKDWIATNVNAGKDRDGIFKILLDEGYEFDAIANEMNYQPTKPTDQLVNPFSHTASGAFAKSASAQARDEVLSVYRGARLPRESVVISKAKPVDTEKADLRVVKKFLSVKECSKLVRLIRSQLRPSELSNDQVDAAYRSSRTCQLGRLGNAFVEEIDIRLCKLVGIHRAYSEILEGQYYQVGQEFKEHTDYFEGHEYLANCQEFGQRTFTVMVYLNDVKKGGETCFIDIGETFRPSTGTAIIWNNLHEDGSPNPLTLHKANKVVDGEKAIITKWFRSKPASGYEYLKMQTRKVNDFA